MFITVKALLTNLWNDRRGVTAMEYGMIAAATIVAIGASVGTIKTGLASIFASVTTNL
jgi:Flp pilus assembly pilin Flp